MHYQNKKIIFVRVIGILDASLVVAGCHRGSTEKRPIINNLLSNFWVQTCRLDNWLRDGREIFCLKEKNTFHFKFCKWSLNRRSTFLLLRVMFCRRYFRSHEVPLLFSYRHIPWSIGYQNTGRVRASNCDNGNERHVCTLGRRRPARRRQPQGRLKPWLTRQQRTIKAANCIGTLFGPDQILYRTVWKRSFCPVLNPRTEAG